MKRSTLRESQAGSESAAYARIIRLVFSNSCLVPLFCSNEPVSMRDIVPRRVHGQRRIREDAPRNSLHFTACLPEPAGGEPIWRAHLEIVTRQFFTHIDGKNFGPRFTPHALGKCFIVGAQFLFNVSRQGSTQAAVS